MLVYCLVFFNSFRLSVQGFFDGVLVYVFMRDFILDFGILRLISILIKCSCMAPLTLVVMVMRGFTFHPLLYLVFISGSYLVCFCLRA